MNSESDCRSAGLVVSPARRRGRIRRYIPALMCFGLIGCSASPPPDKSPVDSRVFREEWFDYYNRALRRIDEGNLADAEADLRVAAGLRPGDSHEARTYGVHRQTYYPHRELGILALWRGDYREAETQLLRSLEAAPTSKGKYFLNEARRVRIQTEGTDRTPPRVAVAFPPSEYRSNNRTLPVEFTVQDDTFVDRVHVNGRERFVELAKDKLAVREEVELSPGQNLLRIQVADLAGRQTMFETSVFLDVEGPALGFDEVRVAQETAQVHLRGGAKDPSGIETCRIGGIDFAAGKREVELDSWFELPVAGDSLPFLVRDALGNETRGTVRLKDAAGAWRVSCPSSTKQRVRVRLVSADPAFALQTVFGALAEAGPELRLAVREPRRQVYLEEFFLNGTAYDSDGVESVSVNGRPLEIRPSREAHFGYLARLEEGTNPFEVEAANRQGEVASATVELVRELPSGRSIDGRLCMASFPFQRVGEVPPVVTETLESRLRMEAYEDRRFRILEREHLEAILQEQEIAVSSLAQRRFDTRVAEIVPADLLLFGKIIDASDGMDVYVDIVDVRTPTEPVAVLNVYHPGRDTERAAWTARGLYLKLKDEFPIVEGEVLRPGGRSVVTNLSRRHRVRTGSLLYVFREGPEIIEEGINYGTIPEDVGALRIRAVDTEKSVGAIEEIRKGMSIQRGDHVIPQ